MKNSKKMVITIAAFMVCCFTGIEAQTDVLNFEDPVNPGDLPGIDTSIDYNNCGSFQDNYGGLVWGGEWAWVNNDQVLYGDIIDGQYSLYMDTMPSTVTITTEDGNPFTWNGADFTYFSPWSVGDSMRIEGYRNGQMEEELDLTLNYQTLTTIETGWENIDSLSMSGIHFMMDNFTFNENDPGTAPVPEPCTMLLFGTGMAGLAVVRKFKNKK